MSNKRSNTTKPKLTKTNQKQPDPRQYESEILYQYWAAAGGKVAEAIRRASDAGDDRVPSARQTWEKYALEHNFVERLKVEESKQWKEFHEERLRKQQHILDDIVHTFEGVMQVFCKTLKQDVEALHSGNPKRAREAERRLTKLFGSMESVDRFYRMHFRALGQPERLTQQTNKNIGANAASYEEFEEEDTRAKTTEELRKRKKGETDEPL